MIKDGQKYEDVMEAVAKEYGPKALALLARVRTMCLDAGLTAEHEPYDMSADDYTWALNVSRGPDMTTEDDLVDISIEIAEEREYDDREGFGLNFGLSIVEYGGKILGQLQPFNYTPDVWVDARDTAAVAARWQLVDQADLSGIPDLIDAD